MPSTGAEVYNNNKKCDCEKKKTKLKGLIGFYSPIKWRKTTEWGKKGKSKRIYKTVKK